ncbi:MAG: SHOCT domain-containing protein, partial [Ruminococcus sp.]|nr:SHOCT domain-containing protein [Ruminococcus sp.]
AINNQILYNYQQQPQTSSADELMKYKTLLEQGAITQEEYDAKKKQILNI